MPLPMRSSRGSGPMPKSQKIQRHRQQVGEPLFDGLGGQGRGALLQAAGQAEQRPAHFGYRCRRTWS
jgi:hypothetical protein